MEEINFVNVCYHLFRNIYLPCFVYKNKMLGVIWSPARFKVLTAVATKVTVFGDMTPCSLVQMF